MGSPAGKTSSRSGSVAPRRPTRSAECMEATSSNTWRRVQLSSYAVSGHRVRFFHDVAKQGLAALFTSLLGHETHIRNTDIADSRPIQ